jgi:hypothetical protein
MDTPNEYSVGIRLIQQYHPDNIEWTVRRTNGYTQWIFSVYPADPTVSSRQYWMDCQAYQWIHPMNIQCLSGWFDWTIQTILDGLSAWPMDTPNKYSVGIRLIRQYHPDNIEWTVRRPNGYTQWIFSGYPADPTGPFKGYWIACQAGCKYWIVFTFFPPANTLPRPIEYSLCSCVVIYGLYELIGSSDSIGYWISDVGKAYKLLITIGHVIYVY